MYGSNLEEKNFETNCLKNKEENVKLDIESLPISQELLNAKEIWHFVQQIGMESQKF